MIGERFGKLTVLAEIRERGKRTLLRCLCECGKVKDIHLDNLRRGLSRSCGAGFHKAKHGLSATPEYHCWKQMKARCLSEDHPAAKNYRDRGISVCPEWFSFDNFYKDMGPRPSRLHSLDRINNDGGYSKDNCRWALREQQQNNMRTNTSISFDGKTFTIANLARYLRIPQAQLRHAIWRAGKRGEKVDELKILKIANFYKAKKEAA